MPWNTFHKESRHAINKKLQQLKTEKKLMFPAGLEPATFRVWGGRDNHYTTETVTERNLNINEPIGKLQVKLNDFRSNC